MGSDPPGDKYVAVRAYSKAFRSGSLIFNSEHLQAAANYYVGWIDLMGAGHVMSTSVQKSANILARLHMAVERARVGCSFTGRILPINDGVFIVSSRKREITSMMGRVLIALAANFIAVPRPHDRFLLRAGVAFGPMYFGDDLMPGIQPRALREGSPFLERVMFGPPLIQAYREEAAAPPYGIAVHESARAFHPEGDEPFRMTHWMWWAPNEEVDYPSKLPPLTDLKACLLEELESQFEWMEQSGLYHNLDRAKLERWRLASAQYFRLG